MHDFIMGIGYAIYKFFLSIDPGSLKDALSIMGVGMLGIYAVVWLLRSVLEPKLIGKQLGLDPLLTLVAMYAGFRFFGLIGMICAPLAAVCVVRTAGILRQTDEN
jgi:predicted PurR-regulated permease PerM